MLKIEARHIKQLNPNQLAKVVRMLVQMEIIQNDLDRQFAKSHQYIEELKAQMRERFELEFKKEQAQKWLNRN